MLKRIRLELARTEGFPDGSPDHGYDFIAPLSATGHIDPQAWKRDKGACQVRRFWGNEPLQTGYLRHIGHGWKFDYGPEDGEDDEPIFKADAHAFVTGNYVSIRERDGTMRPFRVASVLPFKAAAQRTGS